MGNLGNNCQVFDANTGVTSRQVIASSIVKDIFVHKIASDGTTNSIKKTDFVDGKLTAAFILGKVTEVDPTKRWYVTPKQYASSAFSQDSDRQISYANQQVNTKAKGAISLVNELPDVENYMIGNIEALRSYALGTFQIDDNGSAVGIVKTGVADEFYPKPVNNRSLIVKAMPTQTDGTGGNLIVSYQFGDLYNQKDDIVITCDSIELNINEQYELGGLVNLVPEVGAISSTTVVLTAWTQAGGEYGRIKAVGLAAGDFALTNAGAVVAISGVVEVEGVYTITFTLTAATTLVLSRTAAMTAKFFDMGDVTFVTP